MVKKALEKREKSLDFPEKRPTPDDHDDVTFLLLFYSGRQKDTQTRSTLKTHAQTQPEPRIEKTAVARRRTKKVLRTGTIESMSARTIMRKDVSDLKTRSTRRHRAVRTIRRVDK